MKKSLLMVIITVCILVVAGCGGTPPAPTPSVVAPPPPPPPPPPVQEGLVLDGASDHTVVSGDTLADIAATRYGGTNMYFFPLIRLANARVVPNPDLIEVGDTLVVPSLQRNLDSTGASALIREDMLSVANQYERESKPKAAATLRNLATRLSR